MLRVACSVCTCVRVYLFTCVHIYVCTEGGFAEAEVNALRGEGVDTRKPIVAETVKQVADVGGEQRFGDSQSTAAPAEGEGWENAEAEGIAQLRRDPLKVKG